MRERCKKKIWVGFHFGYCSRNAVLDGYCKQHHPESVKIRREKYAELYEANKKKSPWYLLEEVRKDNKRLKEALEKIHDLCVSDSRWWNNESHAPDHHRPITRILQKFNKIAREALMEAKDV